MTTNDETVILVREMLEAGLDVHKYSGRFMYGDHCVSIHTDRDTTPFEVGLIVGKICGQNRDDLPNIDDLPDVKQDSLGMGMVIYWPQLAWSAEVEREIELHEESNGPPPGWVPPTDQALYAYAKDQGFTCSKDEAGDYVCRPYPGAQDEAYFTDDRDDAYYTMRGWARENK